MSKNSKKIIIIFLLLVLVILGFLMYLFYPIYFGNIGEQSLIDEYNSETSLFTGSRSLPIKDGWKGVKEISPKYKVFLTDANLFDPKFTYITDDGGDENGFMILSLKRDNLFIGNYSMVDFRAGNISNKPFTEAVSIAQKYDLSKENPDPQNIRVFEPPSKEQIDRAKAQADASKIPGYTEARRDCILQNTNDPDAEKCMKEVDKKFNVVIPELK